MCNYTLQHSGWMGCCKKKQIEIKNQWSQWNKWNSGKIFSYLILFNFQSVEHLFRTWIRVTQKAFKPPSGLHKMPESENKRWNAAVYSRSKVRSAWGCGNLFHLLDFPSHLPLWTQLDSWTNLYFILSICEPLRKKCFCMQPLFQPSSPSALPWLACLPHGGGHGKRWFSSPV